MPGHTSYIGKNHCETGPGFKECIASFRVFTNALAPVEIQDITAAHPAPKLPPPDRKAVDQSGSMLPDRS